MNLRHLLEAILSVALPWALLACDPLGDRRATDDDGGQGGGTTSSGGASATTGTGAGGASAGPSYPTTVIELVNGTVSETFQLSYSFLPDGRAESATMVAESDGGAYGLTFEYETIIDPCHRPPPVVEGAANDLVMRFQLGGCPTKVALDGLVVEYSYQGGQVSSSFADYGAYGVSITNVDAIGGEVFALEHDYFAGTTHLSYDSTENLIGLSGSFDPKPQQAGSSDPDPIPLTGAVELDALGRVTRISETIGGYTKGVEYVY